MSWDFASGACDLLRMRVSSVVGATSMNCTLGPQLAFGCFERPLELIFYALMSVGALVFGSGFFCSDESPGSRTIVSLGQLSCHQESLVNGDLRLAVAG
ncbi:Uncharacterized protein TCM_032314 [Theobroma cacao]|uniref:Uncharacterized protein n=1 Tax=Theobroma cacao TaxID=3641 RepID=A0A061F9Y4_THECC|nr:Uncharacterized protein TCM_032314 [Theobroma cacao]